jgi:hypothetical protein
MTTTAETALGWLSDWASRYEPGEGRDIAAAILEWTTDAFEHERGATARDVLRHLETTDCGACHAPTGLIYNHDLIAKVPLWWSDIDAALCAFRDETGGNWQPRDALTIGSLVWFAVEWFALEAAREIESRIETAEG